MQDHFNLFWLQMQLNSATKTIVFCCNCCSCLWSREAVRKNTFEMSEDKPAMLITAVW